MAIAAAASAETAPRGATTEGATPRSPVVVLIYLVLGWLFMFLSQYKAREVSVEEEPISEPEVSFG